MYNRYIPQPDGSYRRDRVVPASTPPAPKTPPREPPPPPQPVCEPPIVPPTPPPPRVPPCKRQPPKGPIQLGTFFRNLLPRELDTADLLIIILLLLMAGDKAEDQTNALLTLALYFFM